MNFDRLRFVSERAMLGEGSEVFFAATIPERPGSFEKLISVINPRAVTEFSYRYNDPDVAQVYLSFSVEDRESEIEAIQNEFAKDNTIKCLDISNNELAKSHARYLVGGKVDVKYERIFRFEFPECPGALFKFLNGLKSEWNVTLFHYRNHGSDIAKILAGICVPPSDNDLFQEFLDNLSYRHVEETENSVYKLFLKE